MTALGVSDAAGLLAFAAFWLARELPWWGVAGVLIAVLGCLTRDAEAVRSILSRSAPLRRGPARGRGMGKV